MGARPLVLVIAIYVALDLGNPFMPGAFIFDPAKSVEGAHGERSRHQLLGLTAPMAPRVETGGTPTTSRRHPAPAARRWLGEPRPAHVPASDPPPVSEDH